MNMKTALLWCVILGVGVGGGLVGCAGGDAAMKNDPLMIVRDPEKSAKKRVEAADRSWEMVESGAGSRTSTRESFKALAWPRSTPLELRVEIMRLLLSDTDPNGLQDAKEMAKLMLANENQEAMVAFICSKAAEEGWIDFTTSIVRAWAKPRLSLSPKELRVEQQAIAAMYPGLPLDEVVFTVFLDPQVEDGPFGIDWPARARADAWDVLTQLDPDGSKRWKLLESRGAQVAAANGVREVVDVRVCLLELRTIPRTSQELRWLTSLRRTDKPENLAWWRQSVAVLDGLTPDKKKGLELRHIEPIRWSSVNRGIWVLSSRESLLAELRGRLAEREFHRRTAHPKIGRPRPESLEAWESSMNWGDVLTVLVVDEAIRNRELAYDMFAYVGQDREDGTTEYGGIVTEENDVYVAFLYPPRASTRKSDNEFVASEEMVLASDLSLAHFHLQVQHAKNRKFAGPSQGDLVYAARSGRTCVVFTSIDQDTLNVDVYQPNGVVIDLGEIRRVDSPR